MTLTDRKNFRAYGDLNGEYSYYQEKPANNGLVLAGFLIRDFGTKSPRCFDTIELYHGDFLYIT